MLRAAFGIVLAVVLAGDLAAQQGEAAEGRLNAFACGALVVDQGFDIVLTDDSKQSLALRKVLEGTMTSRGLRIAPRSPNLLTLDTRAIHEQVRLKGRDLVELRSTQSRPSDINPYKRDEEARVNIWSSRRDSVIGGPRSEVERASVSQLRITLRVNDKDNGQCLWQGEAVYRLNGRDEWETAEEVVPHLARAIGETVRNAPFAIE